MARKSTPGPAADAAAFRRQIIRWFRCHGRDLPWRRTRDPYHIVVSEFMLQQTQVSRVEPYYRRFLSRFPTLQSLAAASPHHVRESWEGLGYYRRAANLHRLAREVVRERAGIIPSDPEELRRLPGIGRYTAGAVASFAFERRSAAVDTNVARVLRRAFHPRIAGADRVWQTAELMVPRSGKTAWAFNQAIMELGALVCTARQARCDVCPVRRICATGRSGRSAQHRARKERHQAERARNRRHNPLPGSELVEIPGGITGRIQPAQPSGRGQRNQESDQGRD
jgi:A/G-specific adenine glycosylase